MRLCHRRRARLRARHCRESAPSSQPLSALFGAAPTLVSAISPFLNRIIVGLPRTPYLPGASGFSSLLILAITTLPASSSEISSSDGQIILHGTHPSAQKSTTQGVSLSITQALKPPSGIACVPTIKT